MSLSRPRAVITLKDRTLTSAEAALARAEVTLSLLGSHDAAQLLFWSESRFKDATPGDTLKVALGEEDAEDEIWTGVVTRVVSSPDGMVIDGLSATSALSDRWTFQTYREQTVADIVRDLASEVTIDSVQGDLKLPSYSVDDRESVWNHILKLADMSGAEVAASARGGLRFVNPRVGAPQATLRYGADLLSWEGVRRAQPTGLRVAAHGAGSEAGAEQWHWVLAEPTAVGGGAGPTDVVAALRTRDAAEKVARALDQSNKRAKTNVELQILGNPALRPGDLVQVRDLPGPDFGTLRLLSVTHRLDGRAGFVTELVAEGGS